MRRSIFSAIGLLTIACPTRADDAITPEVVRAVKHATVYIHVATPEWSKSGSGFVVNSDGGTVLVVTNHHVAVKRLAGDHSAKPPAIKVVFDSGTKSERSYAADIVATDAERDLAVLKMTDVRGWNGNKRPRRIMGDGMPAIGIVGRGTDREVNGLGLLFKASGAPARR